VRQFPGFERLDQIDGLVNLVDFDDAGLLENGAIEIVASGEIRRVSGRGFGALLGHTAFPNEQRLTARQRSFSNLEKRAARGKAFDVRNDDVRRVVFEQSIDDFDRMDVGFVAGRDDVPEADCRSRDLTEESKEDRPAVQVGDPFREKLLLEACLELLATDAVAGIQDMGAAGLTCSTCETASRGGTGVEIDLAKVPQRETGMTPYETMLSESQERMLIIVKKGHEQTVCDIFAKWDLPYAEVGVVKDDGMMRVLNHGKVVAEIPARQLADEAPLYDREAKAKATPPQLDLAKLPETDNHAALLSLLAHPSIASKNWVYRQYDHTVRAGTVVLPGSDSAVFLVREANKLLAATSDCNGLYCALDPRQGARIAIAEGARNLACAGATPLAVTDNLNFGNPHKPENFWQLRESVEGLAEGCRAFDVPVTGGNVSLYNESPAGAIDPTPTVGMVGLIEDAKHVTSSYFKAQGDAIVLIGGFGDELGASHFLKVVHGQKAGPVPALDFARERAMHDGLRALIKSHLVKSAHDLSEGGLGVALAESVLAHPNPPALPLGAVIELGDTGLRSSRSLVSRDDHVGEALHQAVVVGREEERLVRVCSRCGCRDVRVLGRTCERPPMKSWKRARNGGDAQVTQDVAAFDALSAHG